MKSVICIPGIWKDRSALVTSITISSAHEYMFAGNILLHLPTSRRFEVEVCDRDSGMANSFKVAGLVNRVSDAFLEEIDGHSSVVYLIGEEGIWNWPRRWQRRGRLF